MLRLKELRLEAGKTQVELAQLLGISRQVYANYENAINEPSLTTLIQCADIFQCTLDFLLSRSDDFGNVATPGAELPADEQELLTNFRALPREEKVQARSYVRYLAERRAPGNKHA